MPEQAILDTLKYRAIFNASLSLFQLSTYIHAPNSVSEAKLLDALSNLVKGKKVFNQGSKYSIQKKPLNWQSRARQSANHLNTAAPIIEMLRKIKWIKLLCVTGSVAAYNASKEDDVDIFVVTEKDRLWITRFFVVTYLKLLNAYPSEGSNAGKICPNIFIDESTMTWPPEKRNIYIANEIAMMHPVINRENSYFSFVYSNRWIVDYLPNYPVYSLKNKRTKEKIFVGSLLLSWVEQLFMWSQTLYMRKKKTKEVTTKNFIHFNKYDHSGAILEKWTARSSMKRLRKE